METKPIAVRLPPELYARLDAIAEREHRSMNGQALTYIELGLNIDAGTISTVELAALNDPVVRAAITTARGNDGQRPRSRPA